MVPALVLACDSAGGTDGICRYKRVHPQAGSNIQYEFSCTRNQIQNLTWMLLNSTNKERAADPEPRMLNQFVRYGFSSSRVETESDPNLPMWFHIKIRVGNLQATHEGTGIKHPFTFGQQN